MADFGTSEQPAREERQDIVLELLEQHGLHDRDLVARRCGSSTGAGHPYQAEEDGASSDQRISVSPCQRALGERDEAMIGRLW